MKRKSAIKGEGGFTLIEVLVATSILVVALLGMLSMLGSTLRLVESGRRLTVAVNLASEKLEMIKSIPYNKIEENGRGCICGAGCGDCTVTRVCTGTSPTFVCIPDGTNDVDPYTNSIDDDDPTINIDNVIYTWQWTVTYLDLDGDNILLDANGLADAGDIKKIDLEVSWNDLLGPHDTTMSVLRKL